MNALLGKIIKFDLPGRPSLQWYVPDHRNRSMIVNLDNAYSNIGHRNEMENLVDSARFNRSIRLSLVAYKSLVEKNWSEVERITSELMALEPSLAAPHLIVGLAYLQQGSREKARSSLLTARTLDPLDKGIEDLLEKIR